MSTLHERIRIRMKLLPTFLIYLEYYIKTSVDKLIPVILLSKIIFISI